MLKLIYQYTLVLFAYLVTGLFVLVMCWIIIDADVVDAMGTINYESSTETVVERELPRVECALPCVETEAVNYESSTEVIETVVETEAVVDELQPDCNQIATTYIDESEYVPEYTAPVIEYVDEGDLYLLAHIIFAEAGSDWCSDEMQMYVGSVVLNRVTSPNWPNTLYEVVYQPGQYECTWTGSFYNEPNQRAWDMAQWLLDNGSQLPAGVVYQSGSILGNGVYTQIDNVYFCYG